MVKKLIDGEIYTDLKYTPGNIFMWDEKLNDAKYYTSGGRDGFATYGGGFGGGWEGVTRLATFEEKEWMLAMIKVNKFIEFSSMNFSKTYELW